VRALFSEARRIPASVSHKREIICTDLWKAKCCRYTKAISTNQLAPYTAIESEAAAKKKYIPTGQVMRIRRIPHLLLVKFGRESCIDTATDLKLPSMSTNVGLSGRSTAPCLSRKMKLRRLKQSCNTDSNQRIINLANHFEQK